MNDPTQTVVEASLPRELAPVEPPAPVYDPTLDPLSSQCSAEGRQRYEDLQQAAREEWSDYVSEAPVAEEPPTEPVGEV